MATITPKTIPQSKLARYHELSQLLEEHKKLKEELIGLIIDAGLKCQPGRFTAFIELGTPRKNPSWKDEAAKLAAQLKIDFAEYEKKVKDATVAGDPPISLKIIDREEPINAKH